MKLFYDPVRLRMNFESSFYIAPEIINDDYQTYGAPSDAFSYAFFLYNMFFITFTSADGKAIRSSIIFMKIIESRQRHQRLKNMPDHYWELLEKCWHQKPSERLTFKEIVDILKDDEFALEEFGIKTDLEQLHEYQKRIDNNY